MTTDMIILSHFAFLRQHGNHTVVIFWMSLVATSFSICISLAIEEQVLPADLTDWLLVFGHCGTYGLIISVNMYVCSRLSGVVLSLIGGTSVIYMVIAQYTLLSNIHAGNHNWLEICGLVLVLVSSIFPSVREERNHSETTYKDDQP